MNFFNPYSYIGGAIILAIIGGTMWYQGTQIHHWHTKYNADEKTIAVLQDRIHTMQNAQSNQTKATENTVIKVVQGPKEVQRIVTKIHDTPEPANCATPPLPPEVTEL